MNQYAGNMKIKAKILAAAVALGVSLPAAARADVIYTFYDSSVPTTVDLGFTVAQQLSPTNSSETMTNLTGVYAGDFTGVTVDYLQGPPGYQPTLAANSALFALTESFSGFPYGNPANGVPGIGTFSVNGNISGPGGHEFQSKATISGVPVPEPASLFLFATGLAGLGLIGFATRRRSSG